MREPSEEMWKSLLSSLRADLKIWIGGGDSGLMQVTLLPRFEEGCCIMTSLFIWSTKSSSFPRIMLNANLVPLPYLDLIPILPLKDLTMFSEMTSPRPIPWVFIYLVFCRQPNNLKSFNLSFFLIPIPESST